MPLAMLHARLRLVLVPASFAMLCGFALLLGPIFYLLLATYAFWVPWDALARWRTAPPGQRPTHSSP